MAVQYNSKDNTWSTWLDIFKKEIPEASEESINAFEKLAKAQAKGYDPTINGRMEKWIHQNKLADESLIKFLKDTNYRTKDLASYQQYLKDTGKATSSFANFTKKAGTVLKSFGATLGSMAVNWAISEVIGLAIEGLDNIANKAEHAKEKADAFSISLSESQNKFAQDSEKISELSAKYDELSKGVNEAGINVSLTSSQYDEYKSVIKQLSDIMPNLTTRFNEQGEAIGFVSGKITDVAKSYQEAQKTQAIDFLINGDNDGNTYEDAIDNLNTQLDDKRNGFEKIVNNVTSTFGASKAENNFTTKEAIDILQEIIDTNNNAFGRTDVKNDIVKLIDDNLQNHKYGKYDTNAYLKLIGKSSLEIAKMSTDEYNEYIKEISQKIESYQQQYEASANTIKLAMNQVAFGKEEYWSEDLGDNGREKVTAVLSGITTDFLKNNKLVSKESQSAFVQDLIDGITENKDGMSDALGSLFELNLDNMNVDDAREKIQQFCSIIANALNLSLSDTQILLGYDNFFKTAANYDKTVAYASNGNYKSAKGITGSKKYNQQDVIKAMEENSINTDKEIDKFKEALDKTSSLESAVEKYRSSLSQKTAKDIKTFTEAFNTSEVKDKLIDLAKSGEINPKVLKSTEEYNKLLEETKTKAKDAVKYITDMLDVQEKMSAFQKGTSSIETAYQEFKDKKFVTAETLESLPDSFKTLKGFDLFSKIVGDPTSGKQKIKKAFDDIVTEYAKTQGTLKGITEKDRETAIANLSDAGVTNAKEVVDSYIKESKKADKQLISLEEKVFDKKNALNKEEFDSFVKNINEKGKVSSEFISNIGIENANMINGLSKQYQDDLTNWLKLCKKKKEAYNKLANAVGGSTPKESKKNYKKLVNKDESKLTSKDMGAYEHATKAGFYINKKGKVTSAVEEESNKLFDDLKFDPIDVDFDIDYSPKDSSKGSGSKDKSKSTQIIDWIERSLNRLNSTIDYTSAKLQNLFSIKAKSNNLNEQIKTSTKLINAYGIAATKYKAKANSVKLSGSLKKAVREGRLKGYSMKELIATYGEKTADKITKYQDYYDKYQDDLKNKQDEIAKRRQYKIDKEQNYVDKADAKYNKNEALKENAKSASEKNTILKAERENLKNSYKHQIKIAKINKDKVEQARLNAELQKKLNDIAIEQHQNIVDELDRNNEALEAQKQNLKTASEKNSIVEQQKAIAKQTYAEQIEIAKLQYGVGSDEVKKLQEEQKSKLADFENEKFENIQTEYSNWLDMIQSRIDGLDGSISIVEAKGITATKGLYQGKVAIEKENLSTLKAEKAALEEQHKSTEVGTALWYSQEKSLNDVGTAIINAQKNMIEYRNSIREANDKVLELKKSFIDLGNIYLDNFEKYLSRYALTDEDTGGLTDKGVATLGIYRKQSISAGEQQKIDMDKLNELEDIIARYNIYDDTQKKILLEANNYDSFEQVKEDYEKYAQAVQDDISNRISAEENIINLMKERYNAELAYIQKLIEDRKQEKDLYDYQKSIQEKVDNISLIQKQLDALRADGSEEAMAKRNVLQEQLDDAKEDLMDVEYDKYISDQQNMLDKLSEDYQNLIEDLLQDVDTLLNEGNEIAKNNGDKFEKAINGFTEKYGETPFTQQQIDVATIKTAVEKEQKDQDAANEVLSAIEKIGTVDLNGEGRGRLVNAENLYKSLTDTQRKIVDENPNGLTLLQKKQQEWVALQAQTQTSMPTSQPSSTPQQSATEAKRAEERRNQQKAQFEQLIKNTYWQNAKYGTNKLFKDNGKETDYTKVQKKIAKNYKRDDFKYVNADWIKEVCKRLGIAQSAGSLLNYMNGIGFSKGGIVETLSKVPGRNGDDGWATLKRGEAVLTPEQTKMFQNMVQVMPPFVNAMNTFTNIPSLSQAKITPNQQSISMGDLVLNLPNVTDTESFIKTIKTDTKVQKAIQQTVCDQLSGRGKLNIMKL